MRHALLSLGSVNHLPVMIERWAAAVSHPGAVLRLLGSRPSGR